MKYVFESRSAWMIWALTVLGTIAAYPSLPPVLATHFDVHGNPNGAMSRGEGALILPLVALIILLIFTIIPRIDPLRPNIQSFRKQYNTFVALLMFFFGVVQALIIARNLGSTLDPLYVILPAVGLLMWYAGIMLPQTKRNWFIGIRTPWTISSDYVWEKTHQLGGTLFKLLGIIILLSVFAPAYAAWIIIVPLIAIVVGLVVYSYVLYERKRKG